MINMLFVLFLPLLPIFGAQHNGERKQNIQLQLPAIAKLSWPYRDEYFLISSVKSSNNGQPHYTEGRSFLSLKNSKMTCENLEPTINLLQNSISTAKETIVSTVRTMASSEQIWSLEGKLSAVQNSINQQLYNVQSQMSTGSTIPLDLDAKLTTLTNNLQVQLSHTQNKMDSGFSSIPVLETKLNAAHNNIDANFTDVIKKLDMLLNTLPIVEEKLGNISQKIFAASSETSSVDAKANFSTLSHNSFLQDSVGANCPTSTLFQRCLSYGFYKCFCVSAGSANYYTASLSCETEGLKLIRISSPQLQNILGTEFNSGDDYWTSGHFVPLASSSDGFWKWVDGSNLEITYSNWLPGEILPSTISESCLALKGSQSLKWASEDCNRYKKFICISSTM